MMVARFTVRATLAGRTRWGGWGLLGDRPGPRWPPARPRRPGSQRPPRDALQSRLDPADTGPDETRAPREERCTWPSPRRCAHFCSPCSSRSRRRRPVATRPATTSAGSTACAPRSASSRCWSTASSAAWPRGGPSTWPRSRVLSHSSLTAGITEHWGKLGENVGVGPDNPTIWNAFLHSAEHYANLVDPAYNRVGVGVAFGGGSEWTCHKFMDLLGGSAPPPTSPPVVGAPPGHPGDLAGAPQHVGHQPQRDHHDCRSERHRQWWHGCHLDHGAAGPRRPDRRRRPTRSASPPCWPPCANSRPDRRRS